MAQSDTPRYAVREKGEVVHVVAVGDHPRVTQILMGLLQEVTGAVGLILVDAPRGEEWLADPVPRPAALEALLSLRDLLGRGLLDVAVYSPSASLEIFIDRFGTLEVKSAAWRSVELVRRLEGAGFLRQELLSAIPEDAAPEPEWVREDAERLVAVRNALGMRAPES